MTENARLYDAAVIGAGPAGAVFASQLARMCPDLKILVIDGQTEDRPKVCGGLLVIVGVLMATGTLGRFLTTLS